MMKKSRLTQHGQRRVRHSLSTPPTGQTSLYLCLKMLPSLDFLFLKSIRWCPSVFANAQTSSLTTLSIRSSSSHAHIISTDAPSTFYLSSVIWNYLTRHTNICISATCYSCPCWYLAPTPTRWIINPPCPLLQMPFVRSTISTSHLKICLRIVLQSREVCQTAAFIHSKRLQYLDPFCVLPQLLSSFYVTGSQPGATQERGIDSVPNITVDAWKMYALSLIGDASLFNNRYMKHFLDYLKMFIKYVMVCSYN